MVNPCGVKSDTPIRENVAVGDLIAEQPSAISMSESNGVNLRIFMIKPPSHFRADDRGLEDHLSVDHAVHDAADAMMPFPLLLSDQIKPRPRLYLLPELGFLDTAESDESFPSDERARVKAGELRRRLDHQHPGKQRPTRDVTGDPELISP